MRYTRLLTFVIILCLGVMTTQAQDSVPTIPVGGSGSSNVPSLDTTSSPFITTTPAPVTEITTTPGANLPGAPATQSQNTSRVCPALVDYQAVSVVCDSLVTNES